MITLCPPNPDNWTIDNCKRSVLNMRMTRNHAKTLSEGTVLVLCNVHPFQPLSFQEIYDKTNM